MIRQTRILRLLAHKASLQVQSFATQTTTSTTSPGDSFGMYWSGLAALAGWAATLSTFQNHSLDNHHHQQQEQSLQMTQDIAVFSSILALLSWNSSWLFRCHLLNAMAIVCVTINPLPLLFTSEDPLLQRFRTSDWQCRGESMQTKSPRA